MSEESVTQRLSQIFESLSCVTSLDEQAAEIKLSESTKNNTSAAEVQCNEQLLAFLQLKLQSNSKLNELEQIIGCSNSVKDISASSINNSPTTSVVNQLPLPPKSRSTPNSPIPLPKRTRPPVIPKRSLQHHHYHPHLNPSGSNISGPSSLPNPALTAFDSDVPWQQFVNLTEHLDVHQVNNYNQCLPVINWQERCLELQIELHRSKSQSNKIRDMLRDKLTEMEQRVVHAEERAEDAEDKVHAMEQKLSDWPTPSHKYTPNTSRSPAITDAEKQITQLESQIEEQKQLRLHDARQVEAKAAKIKEWVTNKLRDLEEQNQVLREQNVKCNQQLELLRNHIATQSLSRRQSVRNSLSLDVETLKRHNKHRRSGSLDPPLNRFVSATHRRNLSMEPQELIRDLVLAVDSLQVVPIERRSIVSDSDATHDYAEIYTPSRENVPVWNKNPSSAESSTPSDSVGCESEQPRPPTPPMHRFPSWEAKIYQVANDGLAGDGESKTQESTCNSGSLNRGQILSDGYCDINVPVYATVKGRASQIRSMPFTGDSSDDSSDGEDNVAINTCTISTHNSHHSSSTDNTETSNSNSASSPSKSLKTSSSLSPAKRSGSESPKFRHQAIAEQSFASGLSDDYAIPPDALSNAESSTINNSIPSILMRASYVDSPNKKLDTLEKTGHLTKLGGKLKTWRKRWFVLKNGNLMYWKNQHEINRKPQGNIVLDDTCRITYTEGASTFEINTGKKIYYLTADSSATIDDWIRVLQNVQRRNATKLLMSRNDQKPTIQGWITKVKNGHTKKCWCILLGKMFLYFKSPGELNPLGHISMRDARIEEVDHISDSDSDEHDDPSQSQSKMTIAIFPTLQGPTYLILPSKQDRDNWLYHLTVVSGGGPHIGTQYEQLVQKLMETDGDPNCVIWRHPILLHTKEPITSPLSTLHSEALQMEALKLFKSCQLFMSVAVDQPGIDYHVVLAQNAIQLCLDTPQLQAELICGLIKQTSRHTGQKLSAGVQAPPTCPIDCKTNPPTYTFVQGWQLLALAVSLFLPKNNRILWYLKAHLSRNADSKTECGKYAAYCERALARTLLNGGRETKPSRMEVLSILLKNPYHHSLPHAIPVHLMNSAYQVVSFDGSTTIEEFQSTLAQEIGCRDSSNGFCLFSDDPIEKDLEHYLDPQAKLCDVISKWETALREKGSGKFENSRVIQLTYKSRLYWKHSTKFETEKERLLLCYQINQQIVQGRFPLSRDLALELASLMAQIDMGDYTLEKFRGSANGPTSLQALDKFYPYRYRDACTAEAVKNIQETFIGKWALLRGRSVIDCVRIYLTCCRKWPFCGAALFQAKPKHLDNAMIWLAVSEDALSILDLTSMTPLARYPYNSVVTFGGCQDDFMLVIGTEHMQGSTEQKLLFALSKPRILEITLLIADYMNALGHTIPGTPQMNTLTRTNSHRSVRSRTLGGSTTATTAYNTLNSHTTHTLNSHAHTLNSHHSHGGQPDILKSTPDHQRNK